LIALIGSVLAASLLGSVHCAGMCGGFLAFAVGDPGRTGSARWLHVAYNAGRLVTYVLLGVIAGSMGAVLDWGGAVLGVQRVAAISAGAVMIGFGFVAVLRSLGVRVGKFPIPAFMQKIALAGHRGAADLPPIVRAAAVGLLTTLLPCGWLYAFVATAAGTGGPLSGAAAMSVFWLGTLPVMVLFGTAVSGLSGPLRRHLPLLTALLMSAVGLMTVAQRIRIIDTPTAAAVTLVNARGSSIGPTEIPVVCHGR